MRRSTQLPWCLGIFTDWSIFSIPFLAWKKGRSGPVTQWRQLVYCDWPWYSHGSLIQGKFDLKINRSMKNALTWIQWGCMFLFIGSWLCLWITDVFLKAAFCTQFFYNLECWSGQDSKQRHLAKSSHFQPAGGLTLIQVLESHST